MKIGSILKKIRKEQGLTLRDLATTTNLSIGFLSNIERDINSPTISSLAKICKSINISLAEIFSYDTGQGEEIIRYKKDREIYVSKKSKITYERIWGNNKTLETLCINVEPGGDYGEVSMGHEGDEIGVILSGSLEVTVEDETYLINEGDSVYIEAQKPHKYRNNGNVSCVSLWVKINSSAYAYASPPMLSSKATTGIM